MKGQVVLNVSPLLCLVLLSSQQSSLPLSPLQLLSLSSHVLREMLLFLLKVLSSDLQSYRIIFHQLCVASCSIPPLCKATSLLRASRSTLIPRRSPIPCSISFISLSDLRPKFFVLSISCSVFCTRSAMVFMSAFFRQLYDLTESSSSSTLLRRLTLNIGSSLAEYTKLDSSIEIFSSSSCSSSNTTSSRCSIMIDAACETAFSGVMLPSVHISITSLS